MCTEETFNGYKNDDTIMILMIVFFYFLGLIINIFALLRYDPNNLKNYRPVSNLPFDPKITEKAVLTQLREHLSANGLLEVYQSEHRKGHSIEPALLAVSDNLLFSVDNRITSVVAFLDLSAAFDTLDHQIIFKKIECSLRHSKQSSSVALFLSF